MATTQSRGNVKPSADQPRVSTADVSKSQRGPTLQYRPSAIKSYDGRKPSRSYGRS